MARFPRHSVPASLWRIPAGPVAEVSCRTIATAPAWMRGAILPCAPQATLQPNHTLPLFLAGVSESDTPCIPGKSSWGKNLARRGRAVLRPAAQTFFFNFGGGGAPAGGGGGGQRGAPCFKKTGGARGGAHRRYMGSDIFYQLGPLTRLGDLLACRCRRLDRQGFLRGQSRFPWLHLRASLWRLSCGLRRRCGRCRRRSSS